MLKKYLLLIIGIGLIGMLNLGDSYTAPNYNSTNFTLCSGYTAPNYNSTNFTLGDSDACEEETKSISIETIYPTENLNATQNEFFNVTLNVTCLTGACGAINVSLDSHYTNGIGSESNPFQITTWEELSNINNNLSASYILMNDLNSSTVGYDTYASSSANGGQGWDPIGGYFNGSLNGNYYVIRDLYINRTSDYIGLFNRSIGPVVIENLGLADVEIYGDGEIGALMGGGINFIIRNSFTSGDIYARGKGVNSYSVAGLVTAGDGNMEISGCYSSVNITALGKPVMGGLIEYYDNANGTIYNSYFNGTLTGDWWTGGIVTEIDYPYMKNVYSAGYIYGSATIGGLNAIGYYDNYNNSGFWNIDTSTQNTGNNPYGFGKNTEQMKNILTYNTTNITGGLNESWSIAEIDNWVDEVWVINNTNDYPKLSWEYFPKKDIGIIPIQADWTTEPFYTNASSNPQTTSSIDEGQSKTITFWVNATGEVDTIHDFYAYANTTSDLSISNETDHWNVTIVTEAPTDSCTYTSGDWIVDCSDNCVINSPVDVGGNDITIIGTGTFQTSEDITGYNKLHIEGTDNSNICRVTCNGGCFR